MHDDAIDIPAHVLAVAYADARRCYPEEACGLLLGPAGAALCDEARPCENQQNRLHARDGESFPRDARTAYALGVRDLRFVDESRDTPRPVKIIYHSHVEVGAYFSDVDRRAATFDGELLYPVDFLVIDCKKDGIHGAKLFRFRDGSFVEIAAYPPAP